MNSKRFENDASKQRRRPAKSGVRRDLAIDRLRGALVILMVIGDYLGGIEFVPSFLKHAPDIGLTIADTVAPAFVFVIGLNFGPSFARHAASGVGGAYRHFLLRYLSLVGIGAIIAAGATAVGQPTDWGVLQAIGAAGMISLIFIRFPTWARFLIGTLLIWGYQFVLDASMLDQVLSSVHGGLFGAVSWGGLLVLSTAVADVWRKGLVSYVVCLIALVIAAGISAVLVPISKHRVSLSFILITLALSALVFFIVEVASRNASWRAGILCWWGENALSLYLIHLLVLAIFVAPPLAWWYVQAPLWLAVIQIVFILALMSFLAWRLHAARLRRRPSL